MKLVLAIRSLNIGGAERQFIELIKNIDKNKFDILVCTMYGGIQEDIIKNISNIKYINLEKKGRYDFFKFYKNYQKVLNEFNPNVIYSFLGEMNLFSLWCKPKKTKVIWGFRSSKRDVKKDGKVSQILFLLQKKLSKKVNKIIFNSYAGLKFHKEQNFYIDNAIVIYNGVDTTKFKKDTLKRDNFRKKYNLKNDEIAIGIVARINYVKGYIIFNQVAKKILDKYEHIKFFSVGDGDENIKKECKEILKDYNNQKFIWLGNQKKVEKVYSGLDIVISSSFVEGFSNSIAEAMSCECACVVTDVGDSKIIVDNIGIVVKPNSVDDLYNGIEQMIKSDYNAIGKKSRERIVQNFSIDKMVISTEKVCF